jgi:hypothetical protein
LVVVVSGWNTPELLYREWLHGVEEEVKAAIGVTLADLPVLAFHEMWEAGYDVYKAAEVACRSIPW